MTPIDRRPRTAIAGLLFTLLAAAAMAAGQSRTALAHAATEAAAPALPHIVGHFGLATLDGHPVTDQSYRGKWLVIYFGYTACPDACPLTLNSIGVALDKLGELADKVQPLFITVDPEHDTIPVLSEYLKSFDPRIVGLHGTPEQTADAAKQYHVYFRARQLGSGQYTIDHSSFLYIIGPDGAFEKLLTADLPGHQLADELRGLVR
jgi:protein SCO1/2